MSFFVAARMHSGQRRRPAKLIAQTAHRKRPHSSQTASAWFSGWWKHVACSATRTAFGTALWGRASAPPVGGGGLAGRTPKTQNGPRNLRQEPLSASSHASESSKRPQLGQG